MKKREFDAIVIGAGSGLRISSRLAEEGLKVAVVDEGAFGGTCLNRGCIPSKMLIHTADVLDVIKRAQVFGIKAKAIGIDWRGIQKRVWKVIDGDARELEQANRKTKGITVYKKRASFIGIKELKVGNDLIMADKIFICAGTRPVVPPFTGLENVHYETSDTVMRLKKQPRSMIILGGGYIAVELGHFFASLGTKVTMINRSGLLLRNEDEEISAKFTELAKDQFDLRLDTNVLEVYKKGNKVYVDAEKNKKRSSVAADALLVATGRKPNSDILDVGKTNVKITNDGYVAVNGFMETNVHGIWAIGDIAGKFLFKHSANMEAEVCARNALNSGSKREANYTAMPHAVFASPQVAGVGMTEQELKQKKITYSAGKHLYEHTGMGRAMEEENGFVKALADPDTKKILGCHILGPEASTLIQEVVLAMRNGLTVDQVIDTIHIHPALPEVVQRAFKNIEW